MGNNYDDRNRNEFTEIIGSNGGYIFNTTYNGYLNQRPTFSFFKILANIMAKDNIDLVSEECQGWLITY